MRRERLRSRDGQRSQVGEALGPLRRDDVRIAVLTEVRRNQLGKEAGRDEGLPNELCAAHVLPDVQPGGGLLEESDIGIPIGIEITRQQFGGITADRLGRGDRTDPFRRSAAP